MGRHTRRLNRLRAGTREILTELRPRTAEAMFAPLTPLPRQQPRTLDLRDPDQVSPSLHPLR